MEEEGEIHFSDEVIQKLLKRGLKQPDSRPHVNVVFIGHVDSGKSTTCGNILFLTGQVDSRTIEKYEREAKEKNRDTWYYAYVMDTNDEERVKGKTVEVGRASFELPGIRYTILDAPGHRGFVPEMLSGAAQADVGVLIISARKGEFEAGYERGGQTREHVMLAKTLGVDKLVVAVNKMDETTCNWSEERYNDIVTRLRSFLKSCGFSKDVVFLPMSGLLGQNLKDHVSEKTSPCYDGNASWYTTDRPTLLQVLSAIVPPKRDFLGPLRIPLLSGYKDTGVVAIGKVESGVVLVDQNVVLLPARAPVKICSVRLNEEEVAYAKPGENVEVRLLGIDEESIRKGCVISSTKDACCVTTKIRVQMLVVELLEHRPLITRGYKAVFHAHTASEEAEVEDIVETTTKATKKVARRPAFAKADMVVICDMKFPTPICLEPFSVRPQLGRFTLRDEGKTVAIGKVMKILDS